MPFVINKLREDCYEIKDYDTKHIITKCSTLKKALKQVSLLLNIEGGEMNPKFNVVKKLAKKHGSDNVRISKKKNKKYDVLYDGKWISFGDDRYQDFLEHKDSLRRYNYRRRASKITNKEGEYTYKNKKSPNYWSYHILW